MMSGITTNLKLDVKIVNGFLKIHKTTEYNESTVYLKLNDISQVEIENNSNISIYGSNGFVQGDRYPLFWFPLAHYCKQDYEICHKHLKEVLIDWMEGRDD